MINHIDIGPITIQMYGLMIAIGYLSAYFLSEYRAKKRGMDSDILFGIFWCAIIGGALGSKLLFLLISLPEVIENPSLILDFRNGWVVYGGIIGGVLMSWGYCHLKKADFVSYLDLVMPAVAFAQGWGRIGCTFAGCCYGRATDSALSITYWQSDFAPNGIKLIPTQIYSSIGDFAIAFLLISYAGKKPAKGRVGAAYCILYSVGRFCIEVLRNDYRGSLGALSTSQIISIFIFLMGVAFYILAGRKQRKEA